MKNKIYNSEKFLNEAFEGLSSNPLLNIAATLSMVVPSIYSGYNDYINKPYTDSILKNTAEETRNNLDTAVMNNQMAKTQQEAIVSAAEQQKREAAASKELLDLNQKKIDQEKQSMMRDELISKYSPYVAGALGLGTLGYYGIKSLMNKKNKSDKSYYNYLIKKGENENEE